MNASVDPPRQKQVHNSLLCLAPFFSRETQEVHLFGDSVLEQRLVDMEQPGVSAQHTQPGKVKAVITRGRAGGGEAESEGWEHTHWWRAR